MMEKENNPVRKIVVKLLNGTLGGCEFTLQSGRTVFLYSDKKAVEAQYQGTLLPDNTVVIPSLEGENNVTFEVDVPSDFSENLILRAHNTERIILPGNIVTVGSQKLAWQEYGDDFSNLICEDISKDHSNEDVITNKKIAKKLSFYWIKYVILAVVLLLAIFIVFFFATESSRKVDSVYDVLLDNHSDYQVLYGRDKILYVLSKANKSAQWASQIIVRTSYKEKTIVSTYKTEEVRIGQWIESNIPSLKFHRVKLDDPQNPLIEISVERNTLNAKVRSDISEMILSIIPYAQTVSLYDISDSYSKKYAIDGLNKIAVPFTEVKSQDYITLVVRGALEDGELYNLKRFISSYNEIWRSGYVQFALELNDDWLKGKSYKYGDNGYVKLSSKHWYFPKNIERTY